MPSQQEAMGRKDLRAVLFVTVSVFIATAACALLSHALGTSRAVWLAEGLLLAVLLRAPQKHFAATLFAAGAACLAGALAGGLRLPEALAAATADIVQTVLMYSVVSPCYDRATGRLRFRAWHFFLLCIASCTLSALLFAGLAPGHSFAPVQLAGWVVGDVIAVQAGVVTLILWNRHALFTIFRRGKRRITALALAGVVVSALAVFGQSRYPLLFAIIPFLVLATFSRGMAAGVYSLLALEAIAVPATLHGRGPFSLIPNASPDARMFGAQLFVLVAGATAYPIGRVLNARRKIEELYRLLAYNSRDLITRGSLDGVRSYASPSVTELLGWQSHEIVNCPAVDIVHPEDRHLVHAMLDRLYSSGRPQEVVYRALTKSGPPVWLEGHFRVVVNPNNGQQQEYIATSRDITERVVAEKELNAAYLELERLAALDGLTQVSNRRVFDQSLEAEWRRAQRDGSQLSLLMLDVDYFKLYNDSLGHPAGDECLRRVAAVLQSVVHRTGDIVARYGGEEFAMLLPATAVEGAEHLAGRIADAIAGLEMGHPGSPMEVVTCSIGVAALTPLVTASAQALVDAADIALYEAKRRGRNRYQVARPQPAEETVRMKERLREAVEV